MNTGNLVCRLGYRSLMPEDLAEWHGAHGLTRLTLSAVGEVPELAGEFTAPGGESYSEPMLATVLAYAYARGCFASADLALAAETDAMLRYLCGSQRPDDVAIRAFRRRHEAALQRVLARLVELSVAALDARPRFGFDPACEASLRLRAAVEADSLALDD